MSALPPVGSGDIATPDGVLADNAGVQPDNVGSMPADTDNTQIRPDWQANPAKYAAARKARQTEERQDLFYRAADEGLRARRSHARREELIPGISHRNAMQIPGVQRAARRARQRTFGGGDALAGNPDRMSGLAMKAEDLKQDIPRKEWAAQRMVDAYLQADGAVADTVANPARLTLRDRLMRVSQSDVDHYNAYRLTNLIADRDLAHDHGMAALNARNAAQRAYRDRFAEEQRRAREGIAHPPDGGYAAVDAKATELQTHRAEVQRKEAQRASIRRLDQKSEAFNRRPESGVDIHSLGRLSPQVVAHMAMSTLPPEANHYQPGLSQEQLKMRAMAVLGAGLAACDNLQRELLAIDYPRLWYDDFGRCIVNGMLVADYIQRLRRGDVQFDDINTTPNADDPYSLRTAVYMAVTRYQEKHMDRPTDRADNLPQGLTEDDWGSIALEAALRLTDREARESRSGNIATIIGSLGLEDYNRRYSTLIGEAVALGVMVQGGMVPESFGITLSADQPDSTESGLVPTALATLNLPGYNEDEDPQLLQGAVARHNLFLRYFEENHPLVREMRTLEQNINLDRHELGYEETRDLLFCTPAYELANILWKLDNSVDTLTALRDPLDHAIPVLAQGVETARRILRELSVIVSYNDSLMNSGTPDAVGPVHLSRDTALFIADRLENEALLRQANEGDEEGSEALRVAANRWREIARYISADGKIVLNPDYQT